MGARLLMATCSATSASVTREGRGEGVDQGFGREKRVYGSAFGRVREGPDRSREDRGGQRVTFGKTTLLKRNVCSKGVHPRGCKCLPAQDDCGQGDHRSGVSMGGQKGRSAFSKTTPFREQARPCCGQRAQG